MELLTQYVSVPLITAIVYGAMALYKCLVNEKEKLIRLIPTISMLFGAILGVIAFYGIKDIMSADNVFVAILIGGASGAAATGSHQIFKQLSKTSEED